MGMTMEAGGRILEATCMAPHCALTFDPTCLLSSSPAALEGGILSLFTDTDTKLTA